MNRPTTPARYSTPAIVAHWLSAALIVLAFVFGLTSDLWPRELRPPWKNAHVLMGVAVALLLLFRLVWRFVRKPPAPVSGSRLEILAIRIGHGALYALIAAAVFTGVRALFLRGQGVDFGLFQIPSPFARAAREIVKPATELHETFAFILIGVAAAHALLALYHQFVRRDGTLDRMWRR